MKKRNTGTYPFKKTNLPQLLSWAETHDFFSYFNGNNHQTLYEPFPQLLFVGRHAEIKCNVNSFEQLDALIDQNEDWICGYLNYDLKNEIEDLESANPLTVKTDHMRFIVPQTVIKIHDHTLDILTLNDPDNIAEDIINLAPERNLKKSHISKPVSRTTKKRYFERIDKIKQAIVEGEYYEINYCIEYTAKSDSFDPLTCYLKLNEVSPMPFSVLMKTDNKYLICASPERFIKKDGEKIISQPIKGTIKRSYDSKEDEQLKQTLASSEKEKAENLMIVDLVRNDLAKSAVAGTVCVDELFGIYSFKKVHQMVSTISAIQKQEISTATIIKNAFPPGSMTGAPKVRVMKETELLEDSGRGLYSGAVGYFTPEKNFDFNVVIRSIIFDGNKGNISFHVGSAVTYDADPEYEYNECLLKAEALFEVLNS